MKNKKTLDRWQVIVVLHDKKLANMLANFLSCSGHVGVFVFVGKSWTCSSFANMLKDIPINAASALGQLQTTT